MRTGRILLILLAAVAVGLSLFNASWIAGTPPGRLIVVANRGITQAPRPGASGPCAGAQILPPEANFIENTVPALRQVRNLGGNAVAVDVRRTADGRMVAFRDETLDCRTDGSGRIADTAFDALRRLDAGYRYTADAGATFPLRGRGVGLIPSVADILYEIRQTPILFVVHGDDPAAADALAAEFRTARTEIGDSFVFLAAEPVAARMRALAPRAFVSSAGAAERCLAGYRRTGWLGIVAEDCRGAALVLTPGANWTLWGWPYRFLRRLAGAGGRAVMVEAVEADGTLRGLARPEQLGEVPIGYRGYLLIEDMPRAGRALAR
ncbi:MAG TPA: glycerophosphodiester phosphodiesterase family protein [Allosphingosinicella sp.]|nr:glycerophosphodiester phosphodiesterase family protein [Allosphingosinicella sp.]